MKVTKIVIGPSGFSGIFDPVPEPEPPVDPGPSFDLNDYSGNEYHLTEYVPETIIVESSLIAGDAGAIGVSEVPGYIGQYISPTPLDILDDSWWMCGWVDSIEDYRTLMQINGSSVANVGSVPDIPGVSHFLIIFTELDTISVSVPDTPGPHFIFGSYNATANVVKLYEDGVLKLTQGAAGYSGPVDVDTFLVGGSPVGSGINVYDEIALGTGIVDDATVEALYDARIDPDDYIVAQLAMSPVAYYHLNSSS